MMMWYAIREAVSRVVCSYITGLANASSWSYTAGCECDAHEAGCLVLKEKSGLGKLSREIRIGY